MSWLDRFTGNQPPPEESKTERIVNTALIQGNQGFQAATDYLAFSNPNPDTHDRAMQSESRMRKKR